MNWLHLHDLLSEQLKREFPHADVRPFAQEVRAAPDWATLERLLRDAEASSKKRVATAIAEFIQRGSWPVQMSDQDRMWISARLMAARSLALQLSVPLMESGHTVQPDTTTEETLFWLLVVQWEALGFSDWLLDLQGVFNQARKSRHSGTAGARLPPTPGDADFGLAV